jgi:hypothetical protein
MCVEEQGKEGEMAGIRREHWTLHQTEQGVQGPGDTPHCSLPSLPIFREFKREDYGVNQLSSLWFCFTSFGMIILVKLVSLTVVNNSVNICRP